MAKVANPDAMEIAYWENQFKFCQEQRRVFENQWFTNMAFYFGRQWAVWQKTTTGGTRLIDPPAPRNRVRLVTNKVRSYVRKELSKLIKQEPIWYVVPSSGEPDDVAAARAAEALTEYILKESHFKSVRRKATYWTVLTGTGFLKTTCPGLNQSLVIEAIPTFHIFVPEIQEETLEGQPYVIHARALSMDTVNRFWGTDIEEGDVNSSGATLEQKFFTALGIRSESTATRKLVYVKEIWIKPGMLSKYPKGGMLILADNKIIYRYEYDPANEVTEFDPSAPPVKHDDYPFKHGEFPFKKLGHIPAGRFYSDSTIVDLIPLQREYNKTRSQMVEMKNRTSKPPMVYQKGAFDPKKVTSEPGQFIPINVGFSPELVRYLTPPDFPSYTQNEPGIIHADMDESAAQSDVTRGGAPTGVEASAAIAFLSEQNDTSLYWTVADIEDAIEGVGQQCLSLAQQFWNDEKIIKIVSKDHSMDAQLFKISDVDDNADLRLEAGSIAPQSQAAKQAFLLGLADRGFPLEKVLRYLNMNETSRMYDELQVDSRQAQRENYRMKTETPLPEKQPPGFLTGQPEVEEAPPEIHPFPTNPYDNHPIHLYEHGLYMKSNEFETLDPVIKQVMLNHYLVHQQEMDLANARTIESGRPGPEPQQSPQPGDVPV